MNPNPAAQAVDRLKALSCALITVESCTGGLIAHLVTNVPGASEVFWGALITYDNSAKERLARVPRTLLESQGAVSPEAAAALAEGGLLTLSQAMELRDSNTTGICKSRLMACISTTGVAGPGGGTPKKPVGLCFVGIAISGMPTQVHEIRAHAGMGREQYKDTFAQIALEYLVRALPIGLS